MNFVINLKSQSWPRLSIWKTKRNIRILDKATTRGINTVILNRATWQKLHVLSKVLLIHPTAVENHSGKLL